MKRTIIGEIKNEKEESILIQGRALNIRNLGKVVFLTVQDYTGTIQVVSEKDNNVSAGDIVEIRGIAKKDSRAKGGFEVQAEEVKVVSGIVEEMPFDLSKNELKLNLNTLLDKRTLSLRHPKNQAIFKLYGILLKSYSEAMRKRGFSEIKTPKILGAASEGGSNFFKVAYFEKEATLAQSPQLYKQIMVGVFERVFEVGPAFRAEPHFTTRHVNEYISLDAEFGFINDFYDVTKELNRIVKEVFQTIKEEGAIYLDMYQVSLPDVLEEIPHFKLSEIKEIIKKEYDYSVPEDTDIDPQGEKLAGKYAKEKFNSDFVFITHYPWEDRPFYTMPEEGNSGETCGFDLLYKGLEIATGGQRIHDYKQLVENLKKKEVSSEGLDFYFDVFKYGMPPHGGWGMGSERIIQQMLGLSSIKEAVLFPRDVKRITP